MDKFDKTKRSWVMSRIKSKNTQPELIVRSIIHKLGYRFRLNKNDLPGKPDIVLPKHRKIIFVHGCFWHGHKNCQRSKIPESNTEFWRNKLDTTIKRDSENILRLESLGWKTMVVWQCEIKNKEYIEDRLKVFLNYGKT